MFEGWDYTRNVRSLYLIITSEPQRKLENDGQGLEPSRMAGAASGCNQGAKEDTIRAVAAAEADPIGEQQKWM